MRHYRYTAYGLRFDSSFPLPELTPAEKGQPDVVICYGEVPDSLPEPSANGIAWQSGSGQVLLSVSEVARYLIVANREIRIHPFPGSSETDIRTFLLGSVLGALLHSWKMLVLHASVIQTARGAVLFMGRSGAGKSTLLGAFLRRGYAMLTDDKAAIIRAEDGVPHALPGLPIIRLTEDAAELVRYPLGEAQMRQSLEKYVVPVDQFCARPLPLYAAYSLSTHNQTNIRLERQATLDGFQLLNRHTYRRRFIDPVEGRKAHFRMLGLASRYAQVVRVVRPDYPRLIDELTTLIEEDLAS
jgi:hypothetical protein